MRYLSLFSGIGGLDLGLERAGWEPVAFCEAEPYARMVLAKHWPQVPAHTDVNTLNGADYAGIDAVVGGFPCQDISSAGRGAGLVGARSGLWFQMLRVIGEARPRWVVAENVPALRTRGYDECAAGLEELGYAVRSVVVGAEHVGAPHRRHRVFIVANAPEVGRDAGAGIGRGEAGAWGRRELSGVEGVVADAERTGLERLRAIAGEPEVSESRHAGVADAPCCRDGDWGHLPVRPWRQDQAPPDACWPAPFGAPQHSWEEPRIAEPRVGRTVDGLPINVVRRGDRFALAGLGNAVVPQVAEALGRAILAVDRREVAA